MQVRRSPNQTGNGANVQDLAVRALLAHLRQEFLHHEPVGVNVGLKHPAQVLFRNVLHIGQCRYAGIIHQNIAAAERIHHGIIHFGTLVQHAHIRLNGDALHPIAVISAATAFASSP